MYLPSPGVTIYLEYHQPVTGTGPYDEPVERYGVEVYFPWDGWIERLDGFSLMNRLETLELIADKDIDLSPLEKLDLERFDLCMELCRLYREPDYQHRQLVRIRRLRRYGTLIPTRQVMNAMEHLTEAFPAVLRDLELTPVDGTALEQLTVYFLFRWWLKAACNGYLWRQAAAAVVSVLTVAAMARTTGDLASAARLYSKEIEHSEDNLTLLRKAMDLPQFSRNELLKLLEVSHAI